MVCQKQLDIISSVVIWEGNNQEPRSAESLYQKQKATKKFDDLWLCFGLAKEFRTLPFFVVCKNAIWIPWNKRYICQKII